MESLIRAITLAGIGSLLTLTACNPLTEAPEPGETFTEPLPGLSDAQKRAFLAGDEAFERAFTVSEGLGPVFNEMACEGCHPADGRGSIDNVVFKFSLDGDPRLEDGGPVFHQHAIPGATPETLPEGVAVSPRLPPPVFGVGLIEAIPAETIMANADPEDMDGDGISGRPNMVVPPPWVPPTEVGAGPDPQLGRFGRKAGVASLVHQVADAYQQDMGITNDFLPQESSLGLTVGDTVPDPEIPASEVFEAVQYVRMLAPPARGEETDAVKRGETLFTESGCADCHVPSMKTGPSNDAAFDEIEVHLYSDLLLHDMGPTLADGGHTDGQAEAGEWRTAPLWGLRLASDPLNAPAPLLHDGRTTDLGEAIRLHGGEASASRDAFMALSDDERDDLIAFLLSL